MGATDPENVTFIAFAIYRFQLLAPSNPVTFCRCDALYTNCRKANSPCPSTPHPQVLHPAASSCNVFDPFFRRMSTRSAPATTGKGRDDAQECQDKTYGPKNTGNGSGSYSEQDNPILVCRRRSRSIWLHFPHLELLYLFWAFEGAVAAQVSAVRNADCSLVFRSALGALVKILPCSAKALPVQLSF